MNRILFWMTGLWHLCNCGYAQSPGIFNEVSGDLSVSMYYESAIFGQGVSFFDFDNDGWDDLTLSNGNYGSTLFRNLEGTFEPWQNFPVPNAKNCLWADLDNDGDNEIIFSTINNGLYLFNANEDGYYIPVPGAFQWLDQVANFNNLWLYGMSFTDINLDGYLDLVVANYTTEKANFAFLNQHNLNFLIDPNTAVKTFHKATFQPAAIDLNHDMTADLYFANDYEQGNDFFYNHLDSLGQNTWTVASEETGLNIAVNSMCNSWCDFDNDQDLDVYVSNLEPGNKLMRNNGNNFFENIADSIDLAVHRQSWSSLWIDVNNDQWSDLLVTSASADYAYTSWNAHLFIAQGNGQFAPADTNTFLFSAYNSSKGDFNRDGLYDIAMSASNFDVFKLYQNLDTTQNKFIRFTPKGKLSNANGIGCHYYLYTNNNIQYGYIQSGENYLGQNSQHIILGLGQNNQADSLVIEWPSGIVDKYYNISHGSDLNIEEGKSRWYLPPIPSGLCSVIDSIYLSMYPNYQYQWSDGIATNARWISANSYEFVVIHQGQVIDSIGFQIDLWNIDKNFTIVPAPCNFGSFGALTDLTENQQYQLSPDFTLSALPIGLYTLNITNAQGCSFDTTFTLSFETEWMLNIADSTGMCTYNFPNSDSTIYSNIAITNLDGWPEIWPAKNDTWNLHITNSQGCEIDTAITIVPIYPPSYTLDTNAMVFGLTLSIENISNGNVHFEMNGDTILDIYSSGSFNIISSNNGCTWMDVIPIEISLPNSISEIGSQSHWTMHGDILKLNISVVEDDIEIFNILGQSIPYLKLDNQSWLIPNAPFPITISSINGNFRPSYSSDLNR